MLSLTDKNRSILSTEDVEGTKVYDYQGNKVGRVDHLMIDKASGRVVSAVINVSGFVGLGHSHRHVRWAALKYNTSLYGYQVDPDGFENA